MRTIKDQKGNAIRIDPETFPEDFLHALVEHEPMNPNKLLKAHQDRATNLVDYKRPQIYKMNPALTNTYMTRREASPLEE